MDPSDGNLNDNQRRRIKDFLFDKKVLVVDDSSSTRHAIIKVLINLGCAPDCVSATSNITKAMSAVDDLKPQIIVSEFNVGSHFGLELHHRQKEHFPSSYDKLFILVTANSTESAVADAAEEDVDSYILKPFTASTLEEYIAGAVLLKVNPSDYDMSIREAKEQLDAGETDQAMKSLELAKALSEKPVLAHYYIAKTYEEMEQTDAALAAYKEGLRINQIHYKCLIGYFELLDKLNRKAEAYVVIQQVLSHFPLSPQRLGKVFQLAVHTMNFTDVERYYDYFRKIDRRPDELTRIVTAGLAVCGRFLIQHKDIPRAVGVLRNAVLASGRSRQFLKVAITSLLDANEPEEAREFVDLFRADEREMDSYKKLKFLVFARLDEAQEVINSGRELIKAGLKDPDIYEVVISELTKKGKEKAADMMMYQALEAFPEQKERFLKIK